VALDLRQPIVSYNSTVNEAKGEFLVKIKSFTLAVLFVCGGQLSWAGLSAGFAAYANADYVTALKEFQLAAERGDARAQVKLGQMFGSSRGVPYDPDQAEKWLSLAAAQGNPIAQYEIGRKLVNGGDGRGAEGVRLLQASAIQNNINAMELLGVLYSAGREVPQDINEAHKWFFNAAARGSRFAQRQTAFLSAQPGVERGLASFRLGDYASAVSELKPLAEMGDPRAQYAMGAIYGVGDGLGIKEDQELARSWIELAAAQKNADAQYQLAFYFEKDSFKKLSLYRLSAAQGNAMAMFRLGQIYQFGRYGVEKDLGKAMDWYIEGANTGDGDQQFTLGDIYTEGKIVSVDLAEAAKWYERSGNSGFMLAFVKVGDIYAQGKGVTKNKDTAIDWYRKAIDGDIIGGHRGLAELMGE
jgi:TPR repeat protein